MRQSHSIFGLRLRGTLHALLPCWCCCRHLLEGPDEERGRVAASYLMTCAPSSKGGGGRSGGGGQWRIQWHRPRRRGPGRGRGAGGRINSPTVDDGSGTGTTDGNEDERSFRERDGRIAGDSRSSSVEARLTLIDSPNRQGPALQFVATDASVDSSIIGRHRRMDSNASCSTDGAESGSERSSADATTALEVEDDSEHEAEELLRRQLLGGGKRRSQEDNGRRHHRSRNHDVRLLLLRKIGDIVPTRRGHGGLAIYGKLCEFSNTGRGRLLVRFDLLPDGSMSDDEISAVRDDFIEHLTSVVEWDRINRERQLDEDDEDEDDYDYDYHADDVDVDVTKGEAAPGGKQIDTAAGGHHMGRAERAAHFAKREVEMRERQREREARKARYMAGGVSGIRCSALDSTLGKGGEAGTTLT